jgi:hypothetical protein
MIQMRENRYEDIRRGVVNRSTEAPKAPAKETKNITKSASAERSADFDPRANQADEYLDDEYNSWS